MTLEERLQKIQVILSDVDGVLTNGSIGFDSLGTEYKSFHVRDGLGIKLWKQAGYDFGIVTARESKMVELRARELKIDVVYQGYSDKLTAGDQISDELAIDYRHICYIGDDLTDLPLMHRCGLAATVADGATDVVDFAHLQTKSAGGSGAVRELIETILRAQNKWDDLIRNYHSDVITSSN